MMAAPFAPIAGDPAARARYFLEPLDAIVEEHDRQEQVCGRLEAMAADLDAEDIVRQAAAVLPHLRVDLPLHTRDEEEDLFPLLERRCRPHDRVAQILDQLRWEHARDTDLVNFITGDLEAMASGLGLAHPIRLAMNARAFAEVQRRHLAWENGIVIPLARQRLTRADLVEFGRRMAERRGLDYPA